jgi:hypothetical protein
MMVGANKTPRGANPQRDSKVCNIGRQNIRRIADDNTALPRRLQVDTLEPGSKDRHDLDSGHLVESARIDLRVARRCDAAY